MSVVGRRWKKGPEERFRSKLVGNLAGCLIWTGATTRDRGGYGILRVDGQRVLAHHYAWRLAGKEVPRGMRLLHNCPGGDNSLCCEVAHLFLGTQLDNMVDMARKWRGTTSRKTGLPYGVFITTRGRFGSYVCHAGERIHLGVFGSADEAAESSLAAKARLLAAFDPLPPQPPADLSTGADRRPEGP